MNERKVSYHLGQAMKITADRFVYAFNTGANGLQWLIDTTEAKAKEMKHNHMVKLQGKVNDYFENSNRVG